MGQNKQQRAQAEAAKPKPEVQPQPTPAPAPTTATAKPETTKAEVISKQTQTLELLKEAWTKRGVDLSKMEVVVDGKFMLVTPGQQWPIVRIGAAGGIELPAIRSFAKAFDAAVEGDKLLAKQTERDAKKTATAAPAKKPVAPQPEEKKAETPTARKAKQDQKLEAQLA